MINKNPKNEVIGPTVILRVLKISGLNSVTVVEPDIRKKPITIITNPTAINNKLILSSVKRLFSSIFNYYLIFIILEPFNGFIQFNNFVLLFTRLLVYLSTCLPIYLFTRLLVYLSTRLLVYSFTCLLVTKYNTYHLNSFSRIVLQQNTTKQQKLSSQP